MKKLIPKESIQQIVELFDSEEKLSAVIIMENKNNEKVFTYKIKTKTIRGTRIILIEIQIAYLTFKYLYSIYDNKKSKVDQEKIKTSKSYAGGVWLLTNLFDKNFDLIYNHFNLYHTGNCIKCNRPLTDLDSIERGIGPVCAGITKIIDEKPRNRENP